MPAATITTDSLDPHHEILIRFKYDPAAVLAIKGLPVRRWDTQRRAWIVPFDLRQSAQRTLERIGYSVTVDASRAATPTATDAITTLLGAVPPSQHRRLLRTLAASTHPDIGGDQALYDTSTSSSMTHPELPPGGLRINERTNYLEAEADSSWLKATRNEWSEFWSAPVSQGTDESDTGQLHRLFEMRDLRRRALARYRKQPYVNGSTKQPVTNPAFAEAMSLEKACVAVEDRYGLSVKAKASLSLTISEAMVTAADLNRIAQEEEPADDDDSPADRGTPRGVGLNAPRKAVTWCVGSRNTVCSRRPAGMGKPSGEAMT